MFYIGIFEFYIGIFEFYIGILEFYSGIFQTFCMVSSLHIKTLLTVALCLLTVHVYCTYEMERAH